MKPYRILPLLPCLAFPALAQDPVWSETYGGTRLDEIYDSCPAPDGGWTLVGTSASYNPQFNPDVWVLHIDAAGNQLWSTTFGGPNSDMGRAIRPTADGGYIVGGWRQEAQSPDNDAYLVKLDGSGNVLWEHFYDFGDDERGHGAIPTSDGGYLIVGQTYQLETVFANYDVYAVKTDALGNVQWQRTYQRSAPGLDGGADVMLEVLEAPNGDFLMGGFTSSEGWDAYVIRIDPLGNELWSRTFGGSFADEAYDLIATQDGNYLLTGVTVNSNGDGDVLLLKIDPQGATQWMRAIGHTGTFQAEDDGRAVRETPDGGFVIAGHTSALGAGSWDAYLLRTDELGARLWEAPYGASSDDRAHTVQVTPDLDVLCAGWLSPTNGGWWDGWILKVDDGALPDCNGNGVLDDQDIGSGTSADCNGNAIPDECDIASGASSDANQNGVPDECECGPPANYCTTSANSAGPGASMSWSGLPSLAVNQFYLLTDGLPAGQFGLYFYGPSQANVAFGNGTRCVGGALFRLNPPGQSDAFGGNSRRLDFSAPPANGGAGEILAGSTWYFQHWYRDPMGGGAGFNLSDGLAVTFCQ